MPAPEQPFRVRVTGSLPGDPSCIQCRSRWCPRRSASHCDAHSATFRVKLTCAVSCPGSVWPLPTCTPGVAPAPVLRTSCVIHMRPLVQLGGRPVPRWAHNTGPVPSVDSRSGSVQAITWALEPSVTTQSESGPASPGRGARNTGGFAGSTWDCTQHHAETLQARVATVLHSEAAESGPPSQVPRAMRTCICADVPLESGPGGHCHEFTMACVFHVVEVKCCMVCVLVTVVRVLAPGSLIWSFYCNSKCLGVSGPGPGDTASDRECLLWYWEEPQPGRHGQDPLDLASITPCQWGARCRPLGW
ncbi:uncharacterized protein [Chlorocebus sabaeus]|uniref:uncharacterized protein n=1 Tax=Chlorocebus sabaeus TaxID=60711 RepID=UPI003BF98A43